MSDVNATEYLRRYLADNNMQLVALGQADNTAIVNTVGVGGVEEQVIDVNWQDVLLWKMANESEPVIRVQFDEMIVGAMYNDS
ncbi:hypothetical protein NVP1244A_091 [Vibrio phage 1.244.A._10N.261.54.C3]|nr:hypothetical protein NVP1244A_091 [Vibrio phage 1.244.A._10N.261.54.C3]AUR98719.1 hypothetical protein NVP1255O_091 [Vibrio phage 1.255.O._10N.286.45.F1]